MSFGGGKRWTAADLARVVDVKEGRCVACWKDGRVTLGCDAHHLLRGGMRIGHADTVALCAWHHRSIPFDGYSQRDMAAMYGPSLAHGAKPFRERYGTDDELLALQERMLRGEE